MYFTTAVRYTTGSDMEMKSKETILTGVLINADINGALGIMRKVFPEKADALAKLIRNSGVVFTPVIVNSINCPVANTKATNNHISFYTTKKVS